MFGCKITEGITLKINWAEKRAKKKQRKAEEAAGEVEPYEINNFEIGSDKFNEYYTVGNN